MPTQKSQYGLYRASRSSLPKAPTKSVNLDSSADQASIGSHLVQQARAFAEQNLNVGAKTQLFQKNSNSRHASCEKLTPSVNVKHNTRSLIADTLSQEKESIGNHLISYQPQVEAF